MTEETHGPTRAELLAAMETNWKGYVAALANLSADDEARFLAAQGYPRAQDLLAHICAWWEETIRVVPLHLAGQPMGQYDVDAFNAAAVARYRHLTRAEMERHFEQTRAALAELIASVPQTALEGRVYGWLCNGAIEHYDEHALPGVALSA